LEINKTLQNITLTAWHKKAQDGVLVQKVLHIMWKRQPICTRRCNLSNMRDNVSSRFPNTKYDEQGSMFDEI